MLGVDWSSGVHPNDIPCMLDSNGIQGTSIHTSAPYLSVDQRQGGGVQVHSGVADGERGVGEGEAGRVHVHMGHILQGKEGVGREGGHTQAGKSSREQPAHSGVQPAQVPFFFWPHSKKVKKRKGR